jgi:hypothetical protein
MTVPVTPGSLVPLVVTAPDLRPSLSRHGKPKTRCRHPPTNVILKLPVMVTGLRVLWSSVSF